MSRFRDVKVSGLDRRNEYHEQHIDEDSYGTIVRVLARYYIASVEGVMTRKLSEIILEIAMQGLKHEKYAYSDVVHVLVFLAHVAWNRDTQSSDYLEDSYQNQLSKFPMSKGAINRELISSDWDIILEKTLDYKRKHFPEDKRIITVCGYTPRETFRIEWE